MTLMKWKGRCNHENKKTNAIITFSIAGQGNTAENVILYRDAV
ncbi:hypothetical protein J14TS5_66180 [Paenibacillus lautus]|nr:hypothetical protein J14TS5_66180 [Paenibacillus lautus]